ncbi:odorant receptor 49b-like [Cylas formicarius]|uniref:odorant receptor 49b-like n=1 Tax=Cylas formicarius TaxID=197179 RepID=UPI0029584BD6|nr:odorant receptor 49b-like [Cylas formicarius]
MFLAARVAMIFGGCWRLELPTNSSLWRHFYSVYSILAYVMIGTSAFSLGANVPSLLEMNVLTAIECGAQGLFCAVLVAKMIACQSKGNIQLIRSARCQEMQLLTQEATILTRIYNQHIKYCYKLTISISVVSISTSVAVVEHGIRENVLFNFHNKNTTLEGPHTMYFWYPFETKNYHTWVLIDESVRAFFIGICNVSVNVFINSVMIFLRAQLVVLQQEFRNFCDKSGKRKVAGSKLLRVLCLKHQKLIKYYENFNDSLKFLVLLEYVMSSLITASTIIEIISGQNVTFSVGLFLTNFGGLMIIAWNSNEIILQSAALATALYESGWYYQDHETQVLLHLMMIRCQKPLTISIGPFGSMTVDAGMSRLRLAYSYTTVMGRKM